MAFDLAAFAALAFALGAKHAFDADHVVAVSNILNRQSEWRRTVALSASWASGHIVTAGLVSAALYFVADQFLDGLLARLEVLVPFLLILVGALGLFGLLRRLHYHRHRHAESGPEHGHLHVHLKRNHEHGAMVGIGVVHGLASNDELLAVLLVGLAAESWWQVLLGVGLFSLGVLVAMALYATVAHGVVRRTGLPWLPEAATGVFSVASIAYAAYLLTGGTGFNLVARVVG